MTDFTEQTHTECIYVFWSLLFEGIPWACAHTARQLLIKSIQDNEVQLEAVAELMLCCKHCFPSLWARASLEPVSLGATIPTAAICRSDHWAPEAADAFSHSNRAPLSIYPLLPLRARSKQTLFTPQPPATLIYFFAPFFSHFTLRFSFAFPPLPILPPNVASHAGVNF